MSVATVRSLQVLVGLCTSVFLTAVACKSDKEAETAGYQPGQVQYPPGAGAAGTYGQQQPAPGYGQGGTTAAPTSTIPGAYPTPTATAAGGAAGATTGTGGATSAQRIDPGAVSIVQPVINELSKAHTVAGAKPLGAPLAGTFQTGQTLETQIQLQPQKCYTIVATALPPVTELNVQIVALSPIPAMAPVLAADSDSGPTAVLGKRPNCYKWPFPLPAPVKVVLQVVAGSGLAAAQVYEK